MMISTSTVITILLSYDLYFTEQTCILLNTYFSVVLGKPLQKPKRPLASVLLNTYFSVVSGQPPQKPKQPLTSVEEL